MKLRIQQIALLLITLLSGTSALHAQSVQLKGRVLDGDTFEPIPYASIVIAGADDVGTSSDDEGQFNLLIPAPTMKVVVSSVGYGSEEIVLSQEKEQYHQVFLYATNAIEAVTVRAPKLKYSNKNNPAVELIRKVVEHRDQNRLTGQSYAEYDQYEKITLGLSNLDEKFKNRRVFKNYQFLFQEDDSVKDGKSGYILPAFIEEKASKIYYRKDPNTKKSYVLAENQATFDPQFVDNEGLSNYFNRLYHDVEIYDNNIMILNNQFLSPIANSAPTFYRYYITDTIKTAEPHLVELSFFPRNRTDMLFIGKLYITLDGRYAVQHATMTVSNDINLNFVRDLDIELSFDKDNESKYFLRKSTLSMDFALTEKGKGIRGKRTVLFSNFLNGIQRPDSVYHGSASVMAQAPAPVVPDSSDWANLRPEPLSENEVAIYQNIEGLNTMSSFKRFMDISALVLSGYKQAGPLEIGPVNTFYSYNPIEGLRLRLGGRTTESFSQRFYAEGFTAYGTEDQRWKYFVSGYYALNNKSVFRFPQHYLRISASHDTKIPGQDLEFIQEDNILLSFKRGENRSFLYNDLYDLEYKAEFRGNFAVTGGLSILRQAPAGILTFQQRFENGALQNITALNTTELRVGLRYAPNEAFYQGKIYRTPIYNEYPVFNLQYRQGLAGFLNGEYSYHNFSASAFKRFWLSQLGYADVTLDGSYIIGDNLPFPLLTMHRANQSYAYQLNSYNLMNFLEFVSDRHAAINVQYYMNGFLFNKIPMLKRLKLREVFSFKGIYGGLRDTNNPDLNEQVYAWQTNLDGRQSSFTFGRDPYMEASFGVANIFKVLRVDAVKRLNYLDHPQAPNWGIRARIKVEF